MVPTVRAVSFVPRATRVACLTLLAAALPLGARADDPGDDDFEESSITEGLASWYGGKFHGRPTASGEVFDEKGLTCAHRTLPFGTVLRVTNMENGLTTCLRVNDRGPFVSGRILDCARGGAEELGFVAAGIARVRIEVMGRFGDSASVRPSPKERKRLERALRRAAHRGGKSGKTPAAERLVLLPVDTTRGPFEVQVGAFADPGNAERLARKLSAEGYTTRLAELHQDGLRRVRVGPYGDRAAAEGAELRLRDAGYPTFLIRADG